MNLKSYLRGIGIGILVTAAVFLVSGSSNEKEMTDAQIKARAKELGMIEQVTLADVGDNKQAVEDEKICSRQNVSRFRRYGQEMIQALRMLHGFLQAHVTHSLGM